MTKKKGSTEQYLKSVKFQALQPRMDASGTIQFLNDAANTIFEWSLRANTEYDYWSMTYNAGNMREISNNYQLLVNEYNKLLTENKILLMDLTSCLKFIKSMQEEMNKEEKV